MKKNLYYLGCTIGWSLMVIHFIFKIPSMTPSYLLGIKFITLSFIVFGLTFLFSYFLSTPLERNSDVWWQNIAGIAFILFPFLELIPFNIFILDLVFFILFLLILINT